MVPLGTAFLTVGLYVTTSWSTFHEGTPSTPPQPTTVRVVVAETAPMVWEPVTIIDAVIFVLPLWRPVATPVPSIEATDGSEDVHWRFLVPHRSGVWPVASTGIALNLVRSPC